MRRFFAYFLFRVAAWQARRKPKDAATSFFSAFMLLGILLVFNAEALITLAFSILHLDKSAIDVLPARVRGALLMCMALCVEYLLLVRGGRYATLAKEFSAESVEDRQRGTMQIVWYLVGTILFIVGVIVLYRTSR